MHHGIRSSGRATTLSVLRLFPWFLGHLALSVGAIMKPTGDIFWRSSWLLGAVNYLSPTASLTPMPMTTLTLLLPPPPLPFGCMHFFYFHLQPYLYYPISSTFMLLPTPPPPPLGHEDIILVHNKEDNGRHPMANGRHPSPPPIILRLLSILLPTRHRHVIVSAVVCSRRILRIITECWPSFLPTSSQNMGCADGV